MRKILLRALLKIRINKRGCCVFFSVSFYDAIYLISSVVIGSSVQPRDSVMYIHISTLP